MLLLQCVTILSSFIVFFGCIVDLFIHAYTVFFMKVCTIGLFINNISVMQLASESVFMYWERLFLAELTKSYICRVASGYWIPWISWLVFLNFKWFFKNPWNNEFLRICSWSVLEFYLSSFIKNSAHLFSWVIFLKLMPL